MYPTRRLRVPLLVCAGCALAFAGSALGDDVSVPEGAILPAAVLPAAELDGPDPLADDFDDPDFAELEVYDPFEPGNRAVLRMNQQIDRFVIDPFLSGYRFVVPGVARRALRRAAVNLNSPVYLMNQLLQLRLLDAAETTGAFFFNTVYGFAGLVDAASRVGLEMEAADFGQTLAGFGVGNGPYIVLPIMGPSTLRDGFGAVVDRAFHPLTYTLAIPVQLMWGGGQGVTLFDEHSDALEMLESSSVDYYAALRSAYLQSRRQTIAAAD